MLEKLNLSTITRVKRYIAILPNIKNKEAIEWSKLIINTFKLEITTLKPKTIAPEAQKFNKYPSVLTKVDSNDQYL